VHEIVLDKKPDLILIDFIESDIDIHDLCRRLKSNPLTSNIPIICITNNPDIHSDLVVTGVGLLDYVTRPVDAAKLMSWIKVRLADAAIAKTLRTNNQYLELEVIKCTEQLAALQNITILALASLAETRDNETGKHLLRTKSYVHVLSEHLSGHPRFSDYLSPNRIDMMVKCVPLHDIGKVGIEDRILLKPGRLTKDEFATMKTHTTQGRDAIAKAQETVGDTSELFEIAKQIVYSHHEKWDGSGYPQGLSGDAIPIPARLMAVADVYDALISRRVYKSGLPTAQAEQIIVAGRGAHFDPDVVDAFLQLSDEFEAIALRFADAGQHLPRRSHDSTTAVV
jgi:putative two-component system response regulator